MVRRRARHALRKLDLYRGSLSLPLYFESELWDKITAGPDGGIDARLFRLLKSCFMDLELHVPPLP